MKKYICYLLGVIILVGIISFFIFNFNRDNKDSNLKKIRVAEVAHTVFYAPQYAAVSQGYFEEEGLDVELILTPGADKVTAAVLSGDAQIGFSGSEACIYVYNAGEKDYQMTFEWALRQNGIDPVNDLNIDTSIAFAAMSGAFIGGQGDFVTLFEPNALQVEKQGFGYVVASIGELGGVVPYTSYSARISYIDNNPEIIEKFTRAIQKGLDFVHKNSDEEVAKAVIDSFPDTSMNDLIGVIKRYREIEAWPTTTNFEEESFYHLQDIMTAANELDSKVNYSDLIYTKD